MRASPFFIIGVSRSGTTLLSLMLSSHSLVAIPYESHFFPDYFRRKGSFGDIENNVNDRTSLLRSILSERDVKRWDKQLDLADIDVSQCTSLERTIDQIYTAYAKKHGKAIWGDKTPAYISQIHILNHMFPSAKFIHIIRDGRDVSMSRIKQIYTDVNDFTTAMLDWARKVECARKVLAMLPEDRWMEIRFEDMIVSPMTELKRATEFLGLDFEEGMLEVYRKKATAYVGPLIKMHPHLSERPSANQTFKWMKALSPADQAIAFEIAGKLLTELGYPEGIKRHPLKLLRKVYHRAKESYIWRLKNKLIKKL